MDTRIADRISRLKDVLKRYSGLAVAFSGGVDSTLLLAAAHEEMAGKKPLVAFTATSAIHPPEDIKDAEKFARSRGIRHIMIKSGEMGIPAFTQNTADRCYICKKIIFSQIRDAALKLGIRDLVHGANADDRNDYRPGMKAADALGFTAPLIAAGFTKSDVREVSRQMGLTAWNKPSSGCLATRIPYDHPITENKLAMISQAERVLLELGFNEVRVRHYDELAKIEVSENDFVRITAPELRSVIMERLRRIGFLFVCVDIEPYRTGRMNRSAPARHRIES